MTLLQSAIFDIGEMGRAIEAWQRKAPGEFAPLNPVAPL
jgi:enoyl-CoA hydratase